MKTKRGASSSFAVVGIALIIILGLYTGFFSGLGIGGNTATPIKVSGSVDGGPLNSPYEVDFT